MKNIVMKKEGNFIKAKFKKSKKVFNKVATEETKPTNQVQPSQEEKKSGDKKMGKFNSMKFFEPGELALKKTNELNLNEQRAVGSKF